MPVSRVRVRFKTRVWPAIVGIGGFAVPFVIRGMCALGCCWSVSFCRFYTGSIVVAAALVTAILTPLIGWESYRQLQTQLSDWGVRQPRFLRRPHELAWGEIHTATTRAGVIVLKGNAIVIRINPVFFRDANAVEEFVAERVSASSVAQGKA